MTNPKRGERWQHRKGLREVTIRQVRQGRVYLGYEDGTKKDIALATLQRSYRRMDPVEDALAKTEKPKRKARPPAKPKASAEVQRVEAEANALSRPHTATAGTDPSYVKVTAPQTVGVGESGSERVTVKPPKKVDREDWHKDYSPPPKPDTTGHEEPVEEPEDEGPNWAVIALLVALGIIAGIVAAYLL